MVRKRAEPEPVQLGKEEEIAYRRACEIASACDNLPPLKEDFIKMDKRISDKTSLNISLPMIIQIVGFLSAMVWGYSQLTSRIAFVENQSERNGQYIDEMKVLQDAPIPSDVRQDELIRVLNARISSIEDDLEYIKRKFYGK